MSDDMGKRIYDSICVECWDYWLKNNVSVKVINEMRLDLQHRARPGNIRSDHERNTGANMTSRRILTACRSAARRATCTLSSHGKSGGLGVLPLPMQREDALPRGTAVLVESTSGLEAGTIVGPASQRHARLLGPAIAGQLLRPFTDGDAELWQDRLRQAQAIFDRSRLLTEQLQLPLEILDVDILFDGSQAILQFLGSDDVGLETLADSLHADFGTDIRFENLCQVPASQEEEDHHGGCGKPDCGKASGGSCTTCGTGGGCSSCAKGSGVDLKDYFAHLRGKMEKERVPLL